MEKPLHEGLAALGFAPAHDQVLQMAHYAAILLTRNQTMNLTAITEPLAVAQLHFLDSAALLAHVQIPYGASLIDVGTGAGFPGIVLKILRPDLKLFLLDSLKKRVEFLRAACASAEVDVTCIHGRAEDLGRDAGYREQFDVATARAVAALPLLSELCLPFVRPGGQFLAMKGPQARGECAAAAPMLEALGGGEPALHEYRLPLDGPERAVISIPKAAPTKAEFPRKWAKMKKDAENISW